MADHLSLQTPQALYYANQWKEVRGGSTAIPDDLDGELYALGPYEGDDEYGRTYKESIEPGLEGGRTVLHAVGTCADGVSTGLTQTVAEYNRADLHSSELIR